MRVVIVSATTVEKHKKQYAGESKGFVEEMRFVATNLHTKEQLKLKRAETEDEGELLAAAMQVM